MSKIFGKMFNDFQTNKREQDQKNEFVEDNLILTPIESREPMCMNDFFKNNSMNLDDLEISIVERPKSMFN